MKRLASQIVLSCCMVGALFASDNPTAFPTRQKIEQLLRSDTAPTKKRMAVTGHFITGHLWALQNGPLFSI
jgi:hypothetical protein